VQIQLVLCATASPILFRHVAALFLFSDIASHFTIHDDFSDQVTGIIDLLGHLGDQWLRERLMTIKILLIRALVAEFNLSGSSLCFSLPFIIFVGQFLLMAT
jgi:hypothetical protein